MSPPLIALLAGPAILVPLAWYALARPQVRGARWYGLVLLTIAFWSATYLWELSADNLDSKVFALKIKYLAVVLLPSGWIGFILSFVGSPPGRVWRRVVPVAIISAIFLTIAWTNDWHGWFWGRLTIEQIGPYRVIHGRAAFFWVNVIYTYVVLAAGLVLLVSHAVHSPYLYKQRARTLIAGTLVPWIGNMAFVLSTEETIIDPTPFLFTCTGVIAAVAVFRYELFEPVPTLRDARIESIGDGIIILDRRWRVADLNPAAEAVLRCTRAEAAGSAIDRLLPGWPVAAGTTAAADVTVGEGPLARVYDVRSSDVRSRAGETTGKVVVLRDVTERRHAELALRESEARYRAVIEEREQLLVRAEEANRLKDEFLATLSHELRTPLTAVLGWTRMLVRAEVQPERVAHALGVIERNAVAQARLVDDLLDISRITGGRLRLKLAKADVSALVREALDAIGPSADAKRITIDVRAHHPRSVDHGRSRTAPAGDLEPAHERDQVHTGGRNRHGDRRAGIGRRGAHGQRHRARHRAGVHAVRVRSVPPGGERQQSALSPDSGSAWQSCNASSRRTAVVSKPSATDPGAARLSASTCPSSPAA